MADVADWIGVIGGAMGAIGGPAGLWAASQQHQENKRQRLKEERQKQAPPEGLVESLLRLRHIGEEARGEYRDGPWWANGGGRVALDRLIELEPLVVDGELKAAVFTIRDHYQAASKAVFTSPSEQVNCVRLQLRAADQLVRSTDEALARAKALL